MAQRRNPKRIRGPFGLSPPPSPGQIREIVEEVIEGISEIKEIPKALVDRVTEADADFRDADRALRGTRVRGKGR